MRLPGTVGRVWRAFGLQPHRVETFKLSTDPLFIEKVRDITSGKVIGELHRRRRNRELLRLLRTIDTNIPAALEVDLVMDDYGTHKTPTVRAWLARHPRFRAHGSIRPRARPHSASVRSSAAQCNWRTPFANASIFIKPATQALCLMAQVRV